MADAEKIREALSALDPADDDLWTRDGLPRTEVLSELVEVSALSRKEITQAAPRFTREHPDLSLGEDGPPETSGAPTRDQDDEDPDSHDPGPIAETEELELEQAEAAVHHAQSVLDAANRKLAEVRVVRDRLVEAKERAQRDPNGTMHTIQSYLRRRSTISEERGSQRARILASGIKPEDFFPSKSPIDHAMRRKTGFGHGRPQLRKPDQAEQEKPKE